MKNINLPKIFFILFILVFSNLYNSAYAEDKMNTTKKSKINTIYALRLIPGQDLRVEIENFAKLNNIKAGFIITTVGSLKKAALRFSDKPDTTILDDKFEIVSLVGTVSVNGGHLHISLSDKDGKTIGAHLQKGSEVYTTAEIIIGEAEELEFKREDDKTSGYKELVIYDRK